MPAPVLSERDLAVLRSFARRIDPSDAGAHNNLGVLYYQKGLIEDATAEFVRALELDPRMQVAQSNLDIAYRESGHYDRRITALRDRVRRHPEDRDARWELGRAHAALGRHAEAIAEFQGLLAWQPADVPAMLQLGLAEKARGNLDTATDWLARACAEDPASAVAQFYVGEVLYNRGLNEAALDALRGAIARNPEYAEAHYLLAFVYGDMGRHEEAREATKRAIKLNPTLARAQANLALERCGAQPAPAGTRDPVTERPRIVEGGALAHYTLGLAFRQKALHEDALREYRLALDAGEDRRLTLQAMAEVHLLRRDLPAALELYDALVRDHADSPKLWNERGVCLHQAGRRGDAIASYERAVAAEAGYQLAWNNLGVARAG
ncbi:MAG: tetratricopeptide repeat protein, partial [Gemmatimonadota bacterium]|nr:tetratricopeptide repeat protein [Gemmatimonadota bacterium]